MGETNAKEGKKRGLVVIRSILISAKSIAGIDFFPIFAQSASENSTVLLSPSEGYTQGVLRIALVQAVRPSDTGFKLNSYRQYVRLTDVRAFGRRRAWTDRAVRQLVPNSPTSSVHFAFPPLFFFPRSPRWAKEGTAGP